MGFLSSSRLISPIFINRPKGFSRLFSSSPCWYFPRNRTGHKRNESVCFLSIFSSSLLSNKRAVPYFLCWLLFCFVSLERGNVGKGESIQIFTNKKLSFLNLLRYKSRQSFSTVSKQSKFYIGTQRAKKILFSFENRRATVKSCNSFTFDDNIKKRNWK